MSSRQGARKIFILPGYEATPVRQIHATECLEDLHTLKRLGWVGFQMDGLVGCRSQDTPTICPSRGFPGCISTGRRLRSVRSESQTERSRKTNQPSQRFNAGRRELQLPTSPASGVCSHSMGAGRMAGESRVRQAGCILSRFWKSLWAALEKDEPVQRRDLADWHGETRGGCP